MNRNFPTLAAAGLAVLLTALGATLPAFAQAPDCTGISDVSDFDGSAVSDLNGSLATVRVASGLTKPTFVTAPRGDINRVFIVEQDGKIKILKNGSILPTPFLDISGLTQSPADGGGDEAGLLGLAFHPDYATNGWFFVYHTLHDGASNMNNVVARYTVSAGDPDQADSSTRQVVITFNHPTFTNHDGGMLAFGPDDGYLYISTGDGGGACDPSANAQNLNSNLGKLLRINVNSLPYTIPPDNPFVNKAGNDEIWSYGLRNPWRYSFDRINSTLVIADVGQDKWEEIDCRPGTSAGGENYGWDHYEGTHCPNPSCGNQGSCSVTSYVGPIKEYCHSTTDCPLTGCSITGGYIYQGCRMSDLHRTYFYADYCSAFIHSFRTDASCAAPADIDRTTDLAPGGGLDIKDITSFGEDARGVLDMCERGAAGSRAGEVCSVLPTLRIMQVSGINAPQFLPAMSAAWTWEDLTATSSHPIANYKVYRSGSPTGVFNCVHQGPTNSWAGGDPAVPAPGGVFYYLITAVNADGEEARPGNRSDGTPRTVNTSSSCPP